jgi:hypothetical protein
MQSRDTTTTGRAAPRIATIAGVILLSLASARAQEGGIELFAGETLFSEGWRLSLSEIYKRNDRLFAGSNTVTDPMDRLLEEHRIVTGIDYGLRHDFTLSALVPTVYREMRIRGAGGSTISRSTGLGDIALLAKYRPFKTDWHRGSFNVAVIGGLELPTGSTSERDNGMRLGPTLQPGSGSWDPIVAVATTTGVDFWRFDTLLLYKANTEGSRDFAHGDFFSAELGAGYRFLHTQYPGPAASARVGVQYRHQEADEIDGTRQGSSGLDEITVRGGITVHPAPEWDIKLGIDVPVYHDVRGTQLVRDLRLALAFGIRF